VLDRRYLNDLPRVYQRLRKVYERLVVTMQVVRRKRNLPMGKIVGVYFC